MRRIAMLGAVMGTLVFCTGRAGAVDVTDYFVTEAPKACMAITEADLGSYLRNDLDTSLCPGSTLVHMINGALGTDSAKTRVSAWSSQTFHQAGGFWRLLGEYKFDPETGIVATDPSTGLPIDVRSPTIAGEKGFNWMSTSAPLSWSSGTFTMELWKLPNNSPGSVNIHRPVQPWSVAAAKNCSVPGRPACAQTSVSISTWIEGTRSQWLRDRRSVSLDKNAYHDVHVVVRQVQWGANVTEWFYFAQWDNPVSGQTEGLGLIEWDHQNFPGNPPATERKLLVDCAIVVPRSTCPN